MHNSMKKVASYSKFAELITMKNLTTYQVAKDTGIRPNTFTDWKQGVSHPKIDKVLTLAEYFGVPFEALLGEEPE